MGMKHLGPEEYIPQKFQDYEMLPNLKRISTKGEFYSLLPTDKFKSHQI